MRIPLLLLLLLLLQPPKPFQAFVLDSLFAKFTHAVFGWQDHRHARQLANVAKECLHRGCEHPEARVDCHPEPGGSVELCRQRGCIYDEPAHPGPPSCFFPDDFGYVLTSGPFQTRTGMVAYLKRNPALQDKTFVGSDFQLVTVNVDFQTRERLRIKIFPSNVTRFEVPISIPSGPAKPAHPLYDVTLGEGRHGFFFEVRRRSTGRVLFSTDLPGLILSDQFLQVPAKLASKNVYGLGENLQRTYRHDLTKWKTWVGYARETIPEYLSNLYGVHPTYTSVESDGNAHAVLMLNSHAQEWSLTPLPGLIYRAIGGVIDLYFFLGPDPNAVNQQYTEAVGRYPIPPFWSLGFSICRFGYGLLSRMKDAKDRQLKAKIPLDSQCADIDTMAQLGRDFTISNRFKHLPQYYKELRSQGIRLVQLLDPFIYDSGGISPGLVSGDRADVWAKTPAGEPAKGTGWFLHQARFPDYTDPVTQSWWSRQIQAFYDHHLHFDGLTIDLNEPTSLSLFGTKCKNNRLNFPPYKTRALGSSLADKSLCPDTVHLAGPHYSVHNLYGWFQSEPSLLGLQAASGERGFVLSRSTFVGSGRWVAHWLGDNKSTWEHLYHSIIGMLQFNRFGIPHVGADICGYADKSLVEPTGVELCTRWLQVGAFYPFSRSHNDYGGRDQDPGAWLSEPKGGGLLVESTRVALAYRYRFLPYLYTLFYQHYVHGSSVVRALWDEFPRDRLTWAIDDQFLWGGGLMISPVTRPKTTARRVYFPDARWYDITRWVREGIISEEKEHGKYKLVVAPLHVIPLHVRGGYVFPLQREDTNTERSRSNHWRILVALDNAESAQGELFVDDGVDIGTVESGKYLLARFYASPGLLRCSVVHHGFIPINPYILQVDIVGIRKKEISSVTVVDGNRTLSTFSYSQSRLSVWNVGLKLSEGFTLEYR